MGCSSLRGMVPASSPVKESFCSFCFLMVFLFLTSLNKQYFLGVFGRACGAQGTSAGADANGCTVGMMDGHVKTSVVPCARIHDIHVHIQNKKCLHTLRGCRSESDEEEGSVSLKYHASSVRQVFLRLAEGLGSPIDIRCTPSALRHQPFYTLRIFRSAEPLLISGSSSRFQTHLRWPTTNESTGTS